MNVSFTVEFDDKELIDRLNKIAGESSANPSVLGKAVASGAKVVYDEIHRKVPFRSGLLKNAVYRYFDPVISPSAREINYRVGVNVTKAPHWWLAENGHNVYEGQRIFPVGNGEFRTSGGKKKGRATRHIAGKPYLSVAWEASRETALQTIWDTYARIAVETINGRSTG